MDVERFIQNARDPDEWLGKSLALRRSADRLWESFFESTLVSAKCERAGDERGAEAAWETAVGYLYSAQMMYGLALETAFKSHIVRSLPDEVEITTVADDEGVVIDATIQRLGVPLHSGHRLEALAERAGLFERGQDALFEHESDWHAVREILKFLTDVVTWRGRYPVPRKPSSAYELAKGVPMVAYGHYMRDWTDQVLDRYQGVSRGARDAETVERLFQIAQRLREAEGGR